MRTGRLLPMMAALALVAGACGGNDENEVVYSPEELGSALLTPDDIGTGWTEDERVVTDTRPDEFRRHSNVVEQRVRPELPRRLRAALERRRCRGVRRDRRRRLRDVHGRDLGGRRRSDGERHRARR